MNQIKNNQIKKNIKMVKKEKLEKLWSYEFADDDNQIYNWVTKKEYRFEQNNKIKASFAITGRQEEKFVVKNLQFIDWA